MSKKKTSSVLESHNIQQLTDFEHIRQRLEMYLGSRTAYQQSVLLFSENGYSVKQLTMVPSLITAIREIWENSIDEHIKAGTKDPVLKVLYNEETLEFEISDNGRGIPIDYDPVSGLNICTMVLTETKTGRNFNDNDRDGVIGMNGLGGSVVMIASESAEIEITRKGRPYKTDASNDAYDGYYKFTQKFMEGNTLFPDLQVLEPSIRKIQTEKTGTTIKFKLSKKVFPSTDLPTSLVYSILKEIASTNPTYKIFLNGERIVAKGGVEKGLFGTNKCISLNVKEGNEFDSTFYVIPNTEMDGGDYNFHMHGLVNNAPSFEGGTHLDTFKSKFALGIISSLERESKKRGLKPNRSDIEYGLLIYNTTKMSAPFFSSQTKSKLINKDVVKFVENAMTSDFFDDVVKKNKVWIDEIYERTSARTNKKSADEDKKAAKRLLSAKVAKLIDASEKGDRSQCTLFLCEGDSAISNLSGARDKMYHGILPLRGKIKNLSGNEKTKELMESMALNDIMASLNLVPQVKAVRTELRYGKLFIAADEDADGANIAALICNFLFKFWPELFEDIDNPFVYIFKTPFIILEKRGAQTKYFYSHDIDQYDPHEWKDYKATRAKGLGTLEIENFKDALSNGFVIPITNSDGKLGEVLDLIFNKERSDDRKDWMKE